MKSLLLLLAALLPPSVLAQEDDRALGKRLARCAAVLTYVQAAPTSFKLGISKEDAKTVGQLALVETYTLLGEEFGRAEIKENMTTFRAELDQTPPAELGSKLKTEGEPCAELAISKFAELKSRMAAPAVKKQ